MGSCWTKNIDSESPKLGSYSVSNSSERSNESPVVPKSKLKCNCDCNRKPKIIVKHVYHEKPRSDKGLFFESGGSGGGFFGSSGGGFPVG